MDIEGSGKRSEKGVCRCTILSKTNKAKAMSLMMIFIRIIAMLATISAVLLMGLNKQSKSITVAIVGTTPLVQTLTAKFNHTPAFVCTILSKTNKAKAMSLMMIFIRIIAMLATISAVLLMGLNKQSKSITVAIVGTTPLFQTLTAKFNHTPAFVYFVIANGVASAYNLFVLSFGFLLSKCKGYDVMVRVTDMVTMSLVATGAAAATSIADVSKNGNIHARWSPICNRFGDFCHRSSLALIAAFVGATLLSILNVYSIITLHKNATNKSIGG